MNQPSPEDGAVTRTPPPLHPIYFRLGTTVFKALTSPSIQLVPMSTPTLHRPAGFLVQAAGIDWECIVEIHEGCQVVAFRSFLPIEIPTERVPHVAALAAHLNASRLIGHFGVEHGAGTVTHVHAMRFPDGMPSAETLNSMLREHMASLDSNLASFCLVAHGDFDPGEVLPLATPPDGSAN